MKLDGRIVEYLESGKFICAFVYEDTGTRLRLFNQNSRETNLPLNRIIHYTSERITSSPSRDDITMILLKTAEERSRLAKIINLDEMWEIVSERSEETFGVDFLASLYFGADPSDDQSASFLRAVIGSRLYFKYKSGSIHVHSPETVAQIKLNQEKEQEQENFITTNSSALRRIWESAEPLQDWNDRTVTLQLLVDFYLFDKDAAGYDLARKLVKSAGLTGPHDIYHLLVKAGVWDKNENIPLLRLDIPTSFPESVMAEVQKIEPACGNDLIASGRRDFRNSPVFTIDGPATRDFDDALHIEKQGDNLLVGIHISDVGLAVKQGTALFNESLRRGTSIYFPEKPLTMLPPLLSEDKLSLIKGRERATLSFLVLLSPKAEILKFEIVRGVVAVKQQLTYQEADIMVRQNEKMAALANLSLLLRQRRVNNGALLLPMPELNISIKNDDFIEISRTEGDTPSRVLVSEFMILANTLGAQFVAEREAPGLFRCQPEPRQRIIDGFEKDIAKVLQQRKRLSPMSLLTTPKSHSGVGAPQYTTVTSPIRRLLDLIMQLQINYLVMGKGVLFSKKDMKHFGAIIQATLEKANQARYLRQRYWILKYLQTRKDERLPALVIESGPKRVHIFLEEFLLDADLPVNSSFRVTTGDTILVKIAKIDPLSNVFRLEW
ncbi:MAG: RNB domain-containing ribonuclease [Deltaproteobacteria bacterium]|jgi:exoribonuclease-2|nr:RNB domain-containing ribonuclease [Deltaproteobacteria bacterium]